MWAVSSPAVTAAESAKRCAEDVRDQDLKARVVAAVEDFAANSVALQTSIHCQLLHQVPLAGYRVTGLSADELKGLYKRLVRQGSKARHVYDHIKSNALHDLCSYCQYGVANTLDHFVPITVVPQLAIDPWNLVPACDRCNKLLLDRFPDTPEMQMLHPYAMPESVSPPTARWLRASVAAGPTPVVFFYADPEPGVEQVTRSRIVNQFERLKLGELYRTVSARELSGLCRSLAERFPGGQMQQVAAHLRELSQEGFATDHNDRRGAMFEALGADTWFTSSGYETGV